MKANSRIYIILLFAFLLNCLIAEGQSVSVGFIIPDTVNVGQIINITDTSQGATTYYWNFCNGAESYMPGAVNLGNLGGNLNGPVYMGMANDGVNYYAFVVNHNDGSLIRLAFGNSYLNIPVSTNLGTLLPQYSEELKIVKEGSNWYGINVGTHGGNVIRLEFGNSLLNIPNVVNMGNIGSLSFPLDINLYYENGIWYGIIANLWSNTITRLDFGNSITNTPTGQNLGNIGNLSMPKGMYSIMDNGLWHVFISNLSDGSISRIDLGKSISNPSPTGVNLGVPSGDTSASNILILKGCDSTMAYILNTEPSYTSGSLVKANFNDSITGALTGKSLGNIANLCYPHSFSDVFRVSDTLYTFIVNNRNNTISRMYLTKCKNPSQPSSTLENPPPYSYSNPGVYDISLTINEGMPTQMTLCKTIVVADTLGKPKITSNSPVCEGGVLKLYASTISGATYSWTGPNNFISEQQNPTITNVTIAAMGNYEVTAEKGTTTSPKASTDVTIISPVAINPSFHNQSQCIDSSVAFTLNPTEGTAPFSYQWLQNGIPVKDGNGGTSSLYFNTSIDSSDIGKYSCVITNACNSVTGEVVLLTPVKCVRFRHKISGHVTYDNKSQTPLSSKFDSTTTYVNLYNSGDTLIATTQTDDNGYYEIINIINGTYYISGSTKKAWGGSNPTDALIVNRNYIGIYNFKDSLLWRAGDVDSNNRLNPTDALIINRRYIGLLTKYPKVNDWKFQKIKVEMDGMDLSQDIKAVCSGDVNASYAPYLIPERTLNYELGIRNNEVVAIDINKTFDIPIYLNDNVELGAIGLKFKVQSYPNPNPSPNGEGSSNFKIIGVKSDIAGLIYNITEDGVNVAWSALNEGYMVNPDKPLFVVSCSLLADSKSINNSIWITSESELADIDANIINTDKLVIPSLIVHSPQSTVSLICYPNPFNTSTNINYSLPEEVNVNLSIYNVLGEKVITLVNVNQLVSQYNFKFDGYKLRQGIYYCRIEATNSNSAYIKTNIMIIAK